MSGNAQSISFGIPLEGDFSTSVDEFGYPLGTFRNGRWCVAENVNSADLAERRSFSMRLYRDRPQTYDAMFRAAVARTPEREAIVCGGRRITYQSLDGLVEMTASGLIRAGLKPGERVAIMLDNCAEYVVAVLACVRAGGIAIPLGTRLGSADVAHVVSDSSPRFVVTASTWVEKFPQSSSVSQMFLVDCASGASSFEDLQRAPSTRLPVLGSDDVMMIFYTSGTTGKPKGACLTHTNFVHTCLHYLYALAIDRPQRSILAVPGTHIAGFGPLISVTLSASGTIVMAREFRAAAILDMMERERVTYAVFVPTMYQLFAMDDALSDRDLSSWRYGVYGGAIMPPATIQRFVEALPRLRMINAYGATETCAVCTIIPPELTVGAPASVGLPLECDDIVIVNQDGSPVEDGESGELWIKGPNVSPGYWKNEEANDQSFKEGYWKSGDIGSRDSKGLIYIHDRLKDMINRGGFKVFSAEVENAIMEHPAVEDCAVVGVPDQVLGEKTFAFVKRSHDDLDEGELRNALTGRIADYKIPDFWVVSNDPVPRNQNGKALKAELRRTAVELAGSVQKARRPS